MRNKLTIDTATLIAFLAVSRRRRRVMPSVLDDAGCPRQGGDGVARAAQLGISSSSPPSVAANPIDGCRVWCSKHQPTTAALSTRLLCAASPARGCARNWRSLCDSVSDNFRVDRP